MLIKYCNSKPLVTLDKLKIGELITDHLNKKIYCKNVDGSLLNLNPGIAKLIEATEFEFTKLNIKYNNTLLKFNKDYQLFTQLVFFSLTDLAEVDIELKNPINNYLGFDEGILINLEKPEFEILDLSDIDPLLVLDKSKQGFKLAFINSTTLLNPNQDYFYKPKFGYWSLLPEATNIKDFNDVYYLPEPIYLKQFYCFRVITKPERESTTQNNELRGKRLELSPLSIKWDRKPTLQSNLLLNTHNIINVNHKTTSKFLSNNTETITLDFLSSTNYILENLGNCNTLIFNFNIFNLKEDTCYYISLNLINFKGLLQFSNDNSEIHVVFENGDLPIFTGNNTIFSFTALNMDSIITVYINQKINNLKT